MKYRKRIIDKNIELKLKYMGALYIKGCKWCGKSTTAKQYSKSFIDFSDPDNYKNYQNTLNEKPSLLLEGEKPRLIDEWQLGKVIWNSVKIDVDNTGLKGQYILTGSATPVENKKDNEIKLHPGTGRFAFITMKPMTLFESGESNGKISLKDILEGKRNIDGIKSNITYESLAYLICRGGWPNSIDIPQDMALNIPKDYIEAVCKSDASRVDGVDRNPDIVRAVLKSYARAVCSIGSTESIIDDTITITNTSRNTIIDYLEALKKILIIEEIPAWNPNIRSKTAIKTSPKKIFVDPSLACAALETSPKELMYDPETYGLLFENLVSRDLSVYAQESGGYLNHYRDRYGLECDNVIHFSNGKYGLIEVKLSGNGVDDGCKNLLKIVELINEHNKKNKKKIPLPDFLMIITGTGEFAYTTKDGILIVPIGCLKD